MTRILSTPFTREVGIRYPIICGAMYPCSNPELVAAVSDAGGIGIVQPISAEYVYKIKLRDALKRIRSITSKPYGMNLLIERSVKAHEDRMRQWLDIAVDEGCRFFVTALGNPRWVVDRVSAIGGIVYHDVTERKWAEKALDNGVRGLICVNNRAGGHAGKRSAIELMESLKSFGVPLICAGGIGDARGFVEALSLGYAGVQMGTRFIATTECAAHLDYKNAIIQATESDIVLTYRVTGVPLSVIRTPYVDQVGTELGPISGALFRWPATKGLMRATYNLLSMHRIGAASLRSNSTKDYYQAGKSVAGIREIEPVSAIIRSFVDYAAAHDPGRE